MTTTQTPPDANQILTLDDAEEILRKLGDPAAAATVRDARTGLEMYLSPEDASFVKEIREMRARMAEEAAKPRSITWSEPEYYGKGKKRAFIGDLMTLEEWRKNVECGGFIDYDGYGYFARLNNNGRPEVAHNCDNAHPSAEKKGTIKIPEGATHVIWINR